MDWDETKRVNMKNFKYFAPGNLSVFKKILRNTQKDTCFLAGGTDFVVKLKEKKITCKRLISLKKLDELKYIKEEDSIIKIGSMTTHSSILNNSIINKSCKILAQACLSIGSTQIRNLGTIGGNIISSSAAADTVVALMALDAVCVIDGIQGEREVRISDLYKKNGNAEIACNEFLKEIKFNALNKHTLSGFEKLGRRSALAIVVVSMGIIMEKDKSGFCKDVKIALGGISRNPKRIEKSELFLNDKEFSTKHIDECLNIISEETEKSIAGSPFEDLIPHKRKAIIGIGRELFYSLDN